VPGVERVTAIISTPHGEPEHKWTLCRVTAPSFTDVDALDRVISLGSILSGTGTLSLAQRTALRTKLQALGEDLEVDDTNIRKLVLRLARKHYRHVTRLAEAFP
jgi:hypothetical protein